MLTLAHPGLVPGGEVKRNMEDRYKPMQHCVRTTSWCSVIVEDVQECAVCQPGFCVCMLD